MKRFPTPAVDRLPILVSGKGVDQLLAVPNLLLEKENQQLPQFMRQHYHGDFATK
jgi:hypothetical protein